MIIISKDYNITIEPSFIDEDMFSFKFQETWAVALHQISSKQVQVRNSMEATVQYSAPNEDKVHTQPRGETATYVHKSQLDMQIKHVTQQILRIYWDLAVTEWESIDDHRKVHNSFS